MNQNDEWCNDLRKVRDLSIKARQQWVAQNYKAKILATRLHNAGGMSYYAIAKATGYSERWVKSMCLTEKGPSVERARKGTTKVLRTEDRHRAEAG